MTFLPSSFNKLTSPARVFADLATGEVKVTKAGPERPALRCVTMLPLDHEDIRKIATAKHVANEPAFMETLSTASLIDFMKRPQDVIEAAVAWRDLGGKFGTQSQQFNLDIKID
jgi:hypothetical protein